MRCCCCSATSTTRRRSAFSASPARSASTRSSRPTTRPSWRARRRSARRSSGSTPATVDTSRSTGDAQLELVARRPGIAIVVAESGIESRAQGAEAELAGANAILVGSALMRAPDPAAKLAELLSRAARQGLRPDARGGRRRAAEAGADLVGFVLVEESPRRAAEVLPAPDDDARGRGVRRRASGGARRSRTALPARGREGARARRRASPRQAGGGARARPPVAGTGLRAPGARGAAEGRIVLAGGLGPENVARRSRPVRPWAVDASSSLEREPGVKDHERVRAYVAAARGDVESTGLYGTYGGRYVPETLVPGTRRARARLRRGGRRSERSPRSSTSSARGTSVARLRCTRPSASLRTADGSSSSARTSATRARTRSTTRSARRCSRSGSGSGGSWRRRARASTASRPPPCAPASGSSASSTWAPRTCADSIRTSSACGFSERRWSRSSSVRAR